MSTNLTQFPILTKEFSKLTSASGVAKTDLLPMVIGGIALDSAATLNINSASIQLGVA